MDTHMHMHIRVQDTSAFDKVEIFKLLDPKVLARSELQLLELPSCY